MKLNVLVIAALVLVSNVVLANEEPRNLGLAVVAVKGSDVFKVIYKNDNASRVKLNVYNNNGTVVFSETITTDGFIRPLNFAGLNPGEYSVEVTEGSNKSVEKIAYKTSPSKIVHVARVANEEKFVLSVVNTASENFVVNIYGANDAIIFTETLSLNGSDAKLYNVQNNKVSKIEVIDNAGVKSVKNF